RILTPDQSVATDESPAATPTATDDSVSDSVARREQKSRKSRGGWIDAIGMAEGGLLTDVAIILDLAAIYIPIFGAVIDPAVPAPFAILYLRRGPRVTFLAIVVATFLMTVLTGPHFGWRLGLRGLVGLFLGWAMSRRWRPFAILAGSTLITTTAAYAAVFGVIFLTGLPLADIVGELRNALDSLAWLISTGAQLVGAHQYWLAFKPYYQGFSVISLRYWPYLLYADTAVVAFPSAVLYYVVANASARLLGHEVAPFPPRWFMWLLRMAYYVFVVPVIFVCQVIWFVVSLPVRGPIWLWRLAHPHPSPFSPHAPRPSTVSSTEATSANTPLALSELTSVTPVEMADDLFAESSGQREPVAAASTPKARKPQTPGQQGEP
ncbi:MAG TPA: DUF2232 domain-containing protein, partial [Ktedonobacterales bacterium]|nr:DUF2232 domain-containing protein [Ktedonobacterales bacterium]